MVTLELIGKLGSILTGLLLLLTPASIQASDYLPSVTMYLSPSSQTVTTGSILTLLLKEDSGAEPINVVATNIIFPQDTLQFLSIEPSDKLSFSYDQSKDGVINIVQGTNNPVAGNQLIATIKFKVIAKSGSFNVVVDPIIDRNTTDSGHSSITSSNSHHNILDSVSSGSYSFIPQSDNGLQPGTNPSQPSITLNTLNPNPAKSSPLTSASDKNKQPTISADASAPTTKNAKIVAPDTAAVDIKLTPKSIGLKDKIIMLLSPPILVVGALAGYIMDRRSKDKKAKKKVSEHHGVSKKETVAEIAARIKRRNRSEETVAELAARIRHKKHR